MSSKLVSLSAATYTSSDLIIGRTASGGYYTGDNSINIGYQSGYMYGSPYMTEVPGESPERLELGRMFINAADRKVWVGCGTYGDPIELAVNSRTNKIKKILDE